MRGTGTLCVMGESKIFQHCASKYNVQLRAGAFFDNAGITCQDVQDVSDFSHFTIIPMFNNFRFGDLCPQRMTKENMVGS